jgi:hypothetical protein
MFIHEIILFINCVKMLGISNEVVPIINLTNNKDTSTGKSTLRLYYTIVTLKPITKLLTLI